MKAYRIVSLLSPLVLGSCGTREITEPPSFEISILAEVDANLTPSIPGWLFGIRAPAQMPLEAIACQPVANHPLREVYWTPVFVSASAELSLRVGGPTATTPGVRVWVTMTSTSWNMLYTPTPIFAGDLYGVSPVLTSSVPCAMTNDDDGLPCYSGEGLWVPGRERTRVVVDRVFAGCGS
jgi:hypothetical protein